MGSVADTLPPAFPSAHVCSQRAVEHQREDIDDETFGQRWIQSQRLAQS